jgi:hypothetical protein
MATSRINVRFLSFAVPKELLFACTTALAAASTAFAHHSSAAFDPSKEVVVEGTVAKLSWTNPHIYLTIETVGVDGQPLLQQVEVGPLAAVQTYGLRKEVVSNGSHVSVRANPNRRGAGRTVRGLDITTSDGTTYRLTGDGRSSAPPVAIAAASSLAGKWSAPPTALAELRQAAATWPLTETGRAVRNLRASARCDAVNPPPVLGIISGLSEIEIGETAVMIRYDSDWGELVRTIPMDEADHPADFKPSPLGHSIGRWDGDTLVIDSTGFAAPPAGVTGILFGVRKHLVERLSLTEDRLHLRYEFTLMDPDYLAEPASFRTLWDHRPDLEPSREACDPDVARQFLDEEQ